MASSSSSASHRHGSFHDCCAYLTVVLGNGTVATCSKVSRLGSQGMDTLCSPS